MRFSVEEQGPRGKVGARVLKVPRGKVVARGFEIVARIRSEPGLRIDRKSFDE